MLPKKTPSLRKIHSRVVSYLGQSIVRGEYLPGGLLPNEEHLATHMAVSRTALREAVKVLTAKGLLEARPKIGTRVKPRAEWNMLDPDILAWHAADTTDIQFLQSVLEVREIFEPAIVRMAALKRTEDQLAHIAAGLNAMRRSTDPDEWVSADLDFHQAILLSTGNELVIPLGALISTALGSVFALSTARSNDHYRYSLPLHEAVYEAIRDRDADGAETVMRQILAGSRRSLGPSSV